jgi:hypothetical protein
LSSVSFCFEKEREKENFPSDFFLESVLKSEIGSGADPLCPRWAGFRVSYASLRIAMSLRIALLRYVFLAVISERLAVVALDWVFG